MYGVQTRFESIVGAWLWYCELVQTVRGKQTLLDVTVAGTARYWVELAHVVMVEHCRFVVKVGASDSYWDGWQKVRSAQTRLVTFVGGIL